MPRSPALHAVALLVLLIPWDASASPSLSLAEEMSPEEEEDGQEAFQAVMQGRLLSDYSSTLLLPAMGLKALSCKIARKLYLSIEESHLISPRGAAHTACCWGTLPGSG